MKRISSKRAKACAIPKAVKERVWERDNHCCVYCHSLNAAPNAHFIRRSHGGAGIEENILTLCPACHYQFDSGPKETREEMYRYFRDYLKIFYHDWDEKNLIYRKDDPRWQ